MTALRSVAVLIISVLFVQLAGGLTSLITPLGLENLGLGTVNIGLVATAHAIGFLIGAIIANRIIRRIGNIRTFAVAAASITICLLGMGIFNDPRVWVLSRLLQGVGFALIFTALEAWLGATVSNQNRGSVLGLYHLVAKMALFLGPLLFSGLAEIDLLVFVVCAIFMCAASLPLGLTYQLEPKPRKQIIDKSLVDMMRLSPAATMGVFIAGIVNTGVMALLPIYAEAKFANADTTGMAAASFLVAAAMTGGMISQWPAGKLSDYTDRRIVVIALGMLSSAASLTLTLMQNESLGITIGVLVIWGMGALSFYGICVATGMDYADTDEMPALMATYLFVWSLGSIIGPLLTGAIMETQLGMDGLFIYASATHALLITIMFVRSQVSEPAPEGEQEDWSPVAPRSTLGSELDPRVEN